MDDALRLVEGGVDGIQIENQGDRPFLRPDKIGFETVAAVTAVVAKLRDKLNVPMGINIHLNGVCQALAIAAATNCQWVRAFELANAYVSSSGIIEAAGPQALRYRDSLHAQEKVLIFGDFHVKHGSHQLVADKTLAGTGPGRGSCTGRRHYCDGARNRDGLHALKKSQPSVKLCPFHCLSAAVCPRNNLKELLPLADGAIVGSSFKVDGELKKPHRQYAGKKIHAGGQGDQAGLLTLILHEQ